MYMGSYGMDTKGIKHFERGAIYGENAKNWFGFALSDMKRRMGWEFPEVIENWLFEFIGEVGFTLYEDPYQTLYFVDNLYNAADWGKISDDGYYSKEEAKQLYEGGDWLFYDEESGYYIASL